MELVNTDSPTTETAQANKQRGSLRLLLLPLGISAILLAAFFLT